LSELALTATDYKLLLVTTAIEPVAVPKAPFSTDLIPMQMPMKLGDIWTNTLDALGRAWWVEISTVQPKYTYFFGPFATSQEAEQSAAGYVEDLQNEAAQGIQATIKRCKPEKLTIDHELGESNGPKASSLFGGPISL
jgi:hypothetical protein